MRWGKLVVPEEEEVPEGEIGFELKVGTAKFGEVFESMRGWFVEAFSGKTSGECGHSFWALSVSVFKVLAWDRWYVLIRSGACMCWAGSHVLSLSGYPFHLIKYSRVLDLPLVR